MEVGILALAITTVRPHNRGQPAVSAKVIGKIRRATCALTETFGESARMCSKLYNGETIVSFPDPTLEEGKGSSKLRSVPWFC